MTKEQVEDLWKEMSVEEVPQWMITAALVFYHRGYRKGVDDMTDKIFPKASND